ncbi:MAG: glycosyltransferase family 2 protein [Anaerolineae bacterium]|nr:glycosyltransferase family 2 protein [Anaerolineae bacterium]
MARIGINPTRGKVTAYRPARVTVAMLTYIPDLQGYFRHRLDVLKLALASLQAHTRTPHDLLVFDNGSCAPVVDFLREARDAGVVDYLLLSSRNLGKIGAFKVMFSAAPGEIIAYTDDDILFYPGWLAAHLEVLQAFPKVGMVSGVAVRDRAARASQTLQGLMDNPAPDLSITRQRRIPDDWEADWAVSVGRDPAEHLLATQGEQEIVLQQDGVEAFGTASHFQFVAPKEVIRQALPPDWSGKLMGEMVELDEAVDALGYLRLSTVGRYVRHLGNALSPQVVQDAEGMGLPVGAGLLPAVTRKHWLLRVPGAGRILRAVYDFIFRILYQGNL